MKEKKRFFINTQISMLLRELIDHTCDAVDQDAGQVGTYYAEKLERAAEQIRAANEPAPSEGRTP